MHAHHFVADAVINHAGGIEASRYSVEPYTQLCLGPAYALLRKPFIEAAKREKKR
jgi:spore coat polysaccharide biosynthesis predicted glycosyltransferase SpsG